MTVTVTDGRNAAHVNKHKKEYKCYRTRAQRQKHMQHTDAVFGTQAADEYCITITVTVTGYLF